MDYRGAVHIALGPRPSSRYTLGNTWTTVGQSMSRARPRPCQCRGGQCANFYEPRPNPINFYFPSTVERKRRNRITVAITAATTAAATTAATTSAATAAARWPPQHFPNDVRSRSLSHCEQS